MKVPDKVSLAVATHAEPSNHAGSIGSLLVSAGKLTPAQLGQVLEGQKHSGLLFGDEAVRLGFLRPRDIDQALARQFDYPHLDAGQSAVSRDLVAAYHPASAEVETFRAIRGQLLARWLGSQPDRKAIAITSPNRGDGRSYVAANLAIVFSQLGASTLVIDADLRNPRQHELFGVNNSVGLSTVLCGRAGQEAVTKVPDLFHLALLPAGPKPPNPGDLVARVPFLTQLQQASRSYDVVIIDTPAANLGNDAQLIACRARGALVIARKNATRIEAIDRLTEHFRSIGVDVLGAILNGR